MDDSPTFRERLDLRRFFHGERPTEGPILLNHRRVFILPNRRGFALGLLLAIQLLAATNYNNNLAFVLSFLIASIALLGILYGFRNLAGLTVRPGRVDPVFAGEPAIFEIGLDNPGRIPRIAVLIGHRAIPPQTVDIPAGLSLTLRLPVQAEHRGWLTLPTITVASSFPLGLFRAWSPINLKQRALVYPAPAATALPFPQHSGQGDGHALEADDFRGFQTYQPGDPLRRIHWKGVAKGQGVQVKEYRGERQYALYLDWSQTPGANIEARLSRLCRWVLDAEQAGLDFGLRLPGVDIPPAHGGAHGRKCLEALALYGIQ